MAGFASTIFMPLTGLLSEHLGWRGAARPRRHPRPDHRAPARPHHPPPRLVTTTAPADTERSGTPSGAPSPRPRCATPGSGSSPRPLIAHGAATSTMTVHLIGYLTSRGHPATVAATMTGCSASCPSPDDFVLTATRRHLRVTTILAAVFATRLPPCSHAAACRHRAGAIITVIGFDSASALPACHPALLSDRYGTTAYATIAGRLAAPSPSPKPPRLAAAGLLHHRRIHPCSPPSPHAAPSPPPACSSAPPPRRQPQCLTWPAEARHYRRGRRIGGAPRNGCGATAASSSVGLASGTQVQAYRHRV
ncbi:hypothetical protein NKG94_51485 [Micromonospora sp. M12]